MKMFKKVLIMAVSVMCLAIPAFFAQAADTSSWKLPDTMTVMEDRMYSLSEGLHVVYDGGSTFYGYKDLGGKEIIAPRFIDADAFSEGLASVSEVYDRTGYINYEGEYIIPPIFKYGAPFTDGKAIVGCPDGYQIIDKSGNFLLEKSYGSISVKGELYYCQSDGGTDLFDMQLKLIKNVPVLIDNIYESDGVKVAIFFDNANGFGAINLDTGKTILSPNPSVSVDYRNGCLVAEDWTESVTTIYDLSGEKLISGSNVMPLSKDVFFVYEAGDGGSDKKYLIKNGVKQECNYTVYYGIVDNLFAIIDYSENIIKRGIIDGNGSIIIPLGEYAEDVKIWAKDKLAIETKDEIIIYDKAGNELDRRKAIGLNGTGGEYAFASVKDGSGESVVIYDFDFNEIAVLPGAFQAYWDESLGVITVRLTGDKKECYIMDAEHKSLNKPEGLDLKPVKIDNFDFDYVSKTPPVYYRIGSSVKYFNGETSMISSYSDNNDKTPYIENGRSMIFASHLSNSQFPISIITKRDSISIAYNNKMLIVSKNDDTAKMVTFDYDTFRYETEYVPFKTPSGFNDTEMYFAYLPIKQIADYLGFSVFWDKETNIFGLSASPLNHTESELNAIREALDTKFSLKEIKKLDASLSVQPYLDTIIADMLGVNYADIRYYNLSGYSNTIPGYEALIDKKKDLILVTEPSKEMLELAAKKGIELEIVPFAKEGFVFLVNSDNKVESLTVDQLRGIYSGKIKNWKEVGGSDMPIIPYQRNESSGSQTIMENVFMSGYDLMEPVTEQRIMSMEGLVDVVAEFKPEENGGIGYSVYYYAKEMYGTDQVRLIKINGIEPATETIASNEYPIIVNYYAVKRKDDNSETTNKLLEYVLSAQGQKLVEESGLVPIK